MRKNSFYILFFALTASAFGQSLCNVKNFGNLQIHEDGKIGFHANLTNDGNFADNKGEAGFYNDSESLTVSGVNAPAFYDFITNVPNDLNLETAVAVTNSQEFQSGRIITPRNTPEIALNFLNDAPYLNAADENHVDGYVTNNGLLDFTFPVGDDFRLRPLSIQMSASENTSRAAYFFENPDDSSSFSTAFDTSKFQPSLSVISPVEFWDLDGDTETSVTLTWDAQSAIGALAESISSLRVVGWNSFEEKWIDLGNIETTGTLEIGTITSVPFNPNDYEALTFGSIFKSGSDLFVYSGISPNGDGKNEFLVINGIEAVPDNKLTIFNRWGVIIYEMENYKNDPTTAWKGASTGRTTIKEQDQLPVGTYFYVLKLKDREDKSGYVYLQR